jgi:hypothetical protein
MPDPRLLRDLLGICRGLYLAARDEKDPIACDAYEKAGRCLGVAYELALEGNHEKSEEIANRGIRRIGQQLQIGVSMTSVFRATAGRVSKVVSQPRVRNWATGRRG